MLHHITAVRGLTPRAHWGYEKCCSEILADHVIPAKNATRKPAMMTSAPAIFLPRWAAGFHPIGPPYMLPSLMPS